MSRNPAEITPSGPTQEVAHQVQPRTGHVAGLDRRGVCFGDDGHARRTVGLRAVVTTSVSTLTITTITVK